MSRSAASASIEASPAGSSPFLETVKKMLGCVPNLFRIVGNSPAALEGKFDAKTHIADGDLQAAISAGYSNAEIIEIVSHVAFNTLTNDVDDATKTDIDLP